jgi:sulfide:quinone oxidoreductase
VLQRPLDELGPLAAVELACDSSPVQLGRPNRDPETARYLAVGLTAREQREDFALATGERPAGRIAPPHDRDDLLVLAKLEQPLLEAVRTKHSPPRSVAEGDLQPGSSVRPLHFNSHVRRVARPNASRITGRPRRRYVLSTVHLTCGQSAAAVRVDPDAGRRRWVEARGMVSKRPRIVIAGGGVAALEAVLALRALAPEPVAIDVVAPDRDFVYRALSVAAPFHAAEARTFPLRQLVEAAGAELVQQRATAVNPNRHELETDGRPLPYDYLLLALGGIPTAAVEGALTFRGPADVKALESIVDSALEGRVHKIVFAVPGGAAWPLPAYELALLTANELSDRGTRRVRVEVVTPEPTPLAVFGAAASAAVSELLKARDVGLTAEATPVRFADGVLQVAPSNAIGADAVVALPRLEGPRLAGIDHDGDGFVATDEFGRLPALADVYAAGDMTQFPLKQGGIATQQADVVAADIASRLGAQIEVAPFRPVLRGLLLTGMVARYLRAEPRSGGSVSDTAPLWWPPAKIAGRYLAPFLAERLGISEGPAPTDAIGVEVQLDPVAATLRTR